jgi:hypothetical protein
VVGDYALDLDTRLLMLLIWLRHYLTGETLGDFFGVNHNCIDGCRRRRRPLSICLCTHGSKRWQKSSISQNKATTSFREPFLAEIG